MKTYSGIRKRLGTRGAIAYLRDYHQQRINLDGTWSDAIYTLESYGGSWMSADRTCNDTLGVSPLSER